MSKEKHTLTHKQIDFLIDMFYNGKNKDILKAINKEKGTLKDIAIKYNISVATVDRKRNTVRQYAKAQGLIPTKVRK